MSAGQQPQREHYPAKLGGVLDESTTPKDVAGGLTACSNLIYRRKGAWGKRSGSELSYISRTTYTLPNASNACGIRWYRGLPTQETEVVLCVDGNILVGGDPGNAAAPSPLQLLATATTTVNAVPFMTSMYDPALNPGATPGGDVLIIAGGGAFPGTGFWVGWIIIAGTPPFTGTVTITINYPSVGTDTISYTCLPSDDVFSIAQAITNLINASPLVTYNASAGYNPFLGQAVYAQVPTSRVPVNAAAEAIIYLGAIKSDAASNAITLSSGGSGPTIILGHTANGGIALPGPVKYDGTNLMGLSYLFWFLTPTSGQFTGCVTWHDHVWFWGDPSQPDTLYACDIDEPETYSFMLQNGGYQIGAGDGDPYIRNCVPIGNILYVFKSQNIYAVSGYDFQEGEYAFNVEPAVTGSGIPAPTCVAVLNNALVYWDGGRFCRLATGSYTVEPLGRTIPITSGKVATANQPGLIRAVAGNFTVESLLNDVYEPSGGTATVLYSDLAIWACALANLGGATSAIVYDDDASNDLGNYAWSTWSFVFGFLTILGWVPFGVGVDFVGTANDVPSLYFISYTGTPTTPGYISMTLLGGDPSADVVFGPGSPARANISFLAQTGWLTFGTPALTKTLHQVFMDLEASPGATINITVIAAGPLNGTQLYVPPPQAVVFLSATVGAANTEAFQVLIGSLEPELEGYAFMLIFSEVGNSTSYEITGVTFDAIENPFRP